MGIYLGSYRTQLIEKKCALESRPEMERAIVNSKSAPAQFKINDNQRLLFWSVDWFRRGSFEEFGRCAS
jgi:hypothetical protein